MTELDRKKNFNFAAKPQNRRGLKVDIRKIRQT